MIQFKIVLCRRECMFIKLPARRFEATQDQQKENDI